MKRRVPHIFSILLIAVLLVTSILGVSSTLVRNTAESGIQSAVDAEGEETAVWDEIKKQMGTMMTIEAEAATNAEKTTENYTATTFYPKAEKFLNTPSLWKTSEALNNCYIGAKLYCQYMSGLSDFKAFPSYTNPSEILPGDVIQIKGHYLVCLDCSASGGRISLRTFETNWPNGSYTIGNGIYWVKDNKIHRNGTSQDRPFVQGWHIISSFYDAAKTCVDSKFYTGMYNDIANAIGTNYTKLLSHYMEFGVQEGRTASPSFDIKVYVSQNSDIKSAFGSNYRQAFYHYITFGIFEKNRKASHFYEGSYYLSKYSDLSRAFGSSSKAYIKAAKHFNESGVYEQRQAIASFSVLKYKNFYPDLSAVFSNNWLKYYIHYIQFGIKEGRTAK